MTTLTFLGHAGLAVRANAFRLLADPWFAATGAFLGSYPHILAYGETITVVSVIALGLFAALARDVRKPLAAILVALFSLFHGYVHTAETPHQASWWCLVSPCLPLKLSRSHPC